MFVLNYNMLFIDLLFQCDEVYGEDLHILDLDVGFGANDDPYGELLRSRLLHPG